MALTPSRPQGSDHNLACNFIKLSELPNCLVCPVWVGCGVEVTFDTSFLLPSPTAASRWCRWRGSPWRIIWPSPAPTGRWTASSAGAASQVKYSPTCPLSSDLHRTVVPLVGKETIRPLTLRPSTFHSHMIRPCTLYPGVFTSPYVSSLKCGNHIQG
jgi:hypothetical protein